MNNITREDIAEFINNEFGLTKKDCINLVNDIIEEIIQGLNKNKIVKIHNFGTFKLRKKNARIGRNPKTKEEVMIAPRNVISFLPSKHILKKLNDYNVQ
ncbi:MAG: integration host factor subunit alpha [Pelagibacteraceae bacterium]|jgi:integration host factor subunit alpha|nr:integration host factor subunit alpha [Pelagibacteraceae bacterium]HJO14131.1 integration host factor subunit alpha [Alphaproteobacteria bacterium]MBO6466473.1 integration host factor subunit alpha [Pelagibacteraceae bacterium]MBO6468230.1 integration host factor subunit alpha [Pelagibacteraceae bacterium]MBO6469508.1 integration host factor subunit alpha [Pelagibacteraceae bacterium]|tara:strand:- start:3020 stop:3316 length:297 start_codon:yes stop_codon:yes gene_type:complete